MLMIFSQVNGMIIWNDLDERRREKIKEGRQELQIK